MVNWATPTASGVSFRTTASLTPSPLTPSFQTCSDAAPLQEARETPHSFSEWTMKRFGPEAQSN